jgi:hypothetical protein
MKKRVYVKPVAPGGLFGWMAVELTIWESFRDDWQRYGARIAIENLCIEFLMRERGK